MSTWMYLTQAKGPEAVELSYRKSVPFREEGLPRGGPTVNDSYFFTGIKLGLKL